MNDQVDEIKSKVDIVNLIGERVQLKKAGKNYKALCPFHSEKTPSFMVSPELQMYKCFGCFPAGQFVKTPFGYHRIEDVLDGEYVVSGTGNIRKVLATHKRNYKGNVVTAKVSQLSEPVTLTEDHMVYVVSGARMYMERYKYLSKRLNIYKKKFSEVERWEKIWSFFPIKKIKAGEIRRGMSLLYPVDTVVKDVSILDLTDYITKVWPAHGTKPLIPPLQVKVDEDFLKLVGYYVAEGSNHRAYIRFSLGNHEEKFAQEIVHLIRKIFGIETKIYKRSTSEKTGLEVTACNSILANVFENLCGHGAENKHVPFIFQQLPFSKQRILLEAIFKGDGFQYIGKKARYPCYTITTVSRVLSEQLVDILLRLGYFPSRNIEKEKIDKKQIHHKVAFTVSWVPNPKASKFHHLYKTQEGDVFWLLPLLKVHKKRFAGKVYNLTVEKDHSYVANNFAVANCGRGGDVYTFLQEYEGMEFYEALKYLGDKVGIKLKSFRPGETSEKERLYEVNNIVNRLYQFILLNHPKGKVALDYLIKQRGLKLDTIKTFQLGFSPNHPHFLQSLVDKKKVNTKDLDKVGLVYYSEGRHFDRFRGRIIFPLFDHRGNIVGFSGRTLPEAGSQLAKYINTPETLLYHKSNVLYGLNITRSRIKEKRIAIVVEGEFDFLSSWQEGVKNIVAIKGSALTSEQTKLLQRFTDKIILALDTDIAGDEASKRGIAEAQRSGLEIRVARLTPYKDPDEAIRRDPESFKTSLIKAIGVWDFLLDYVFARYKASSGEGKGKISREVVPILTSIPDKIVQAHYIKKVADSLGVNEDAVVKEVERHDSIDRKEASDKKIRVLKVEDLEKEKGGRRKILEERLLTLAFQSDPEIINKNMVKDLIVTPLAKRILDLYLEFSRYHDTFSPSIFAGFLPKELLNGFATMVLADVGEEVADAKLAQREFELVVRELEILDIRQRLEILGSKIRQFEEREERDKLLSSQKKFSLLTQKLAELEEEGKRSIIFH